LPDYIKEKHLQRIALNICNYNLTHEIHKKKREIQDLTKILETFEQDHKNQEKDFLYLRN